MSEKVCEFMWYELMTSDTAGAKSFYSSVVGWETQTAPAPNDFYTMLKAGGQGVAGLMQMCEAGGKPGWVGYIEVDDVDAYVERVTGAGGKSVCPPMDIPGVGRFAVMADPGGAVFNMMTPMQRTDEGCSEAGAKLAADAPGNCGWRELHAANGDEAWEFYSKLFGWTKTAEMPMGEMGVYQMWGAGGESQGAMMTKTPETPAPFWNYYFNVPAINSAVERIQAGGGQILMGPMEVPGPMWIVQGMDPQGAMFALVAPAQ